MGGWLAMLLSSLTFKSTKHSLKKKSINIPVIPALRRQEQAQFEFETRQCYAVKKPKAKQGQRG